MLNKPVYRINTFYGDWYETDNRGYIVRCDNGLNKVDAPLSDIMNWQITGIREVMAFDNLSGLIYLDDAVKIDPKNLIRKNGSAKYTIEDIDHGTKRIHGNYKVHGVKSIIQLQ